MKSRVLSHRNDRWTGQACGRRPRPMTGGGCNMTGRHAFIWYLHGPNLLILALVCGALLISGAIGLYFSYQENKIALSSVQREKALGAAARIERAMLLYQNCPLRPIERRLDTPSSRDQMRSSFSR